MKANQSVTYVDARGEDHPATVTAVVGTGESNYKRLDVRYGETVETDVPHFVDAKGEGYWLEGTPTRIYDGDNAASLPPLSEPVEVPPEPLLYAGHELPAYTITPVARRRGK